MGRKLDALLGRTTFKTSKFRSLLNLAVSRLAVLKNQRQACRSLARSDVLQFLNLGHHHDRALLRVEQVIKEQNMLDVFVMMEGYCHLLAERIDLIEHAKECPEELKEAISGLLYASTRCGMFPELVEMRAIFTSRFGKEFAARGIELRNNCGVNVKMIQKLSTKQPSLENRMKVLKEIASENNIVLQIEEASSVITKLQEEMEAEQKPHQTNTQLSAVSSSSKAGDSLHDLPEGVENMEGWSDSMKTRKYKDVADAAEAAFKSAAYAAAAARAAVELSRSESHDPNDQNSPGSGKRKESDEHYETKSELQTTEDRRVGMEFEKVHPIQNYRSEFEDDEIQGEKRAEKSEQINIAVPGVNSADSDGGVSTGTSIPVDVVAEAKPIDEGIYFDENDHDTGNEQGIVLESSLEMKPSFLMTEGLSSEKHNTVVDHDLHQREGSKLYRSKKRFPLTSQTGVQAEAGPGNPEAHFADRSRMQRLKYLNAEKRPISVRTRRAQGD
ncbi:uncharacterized protein LOC127806394 [Diospyros lotus]|uniref:uncharacterized protein LOC127806394 n=1 Tax=Diospyros lotus TaxID=55363 RepID=UPI002258BFB7|nr:uncharacterized protein LOC127806394 [Diospyros lotus]